MSFLKHIEVCNTHDMDNFKPFLINGMEIGYIRHDFADILLSFKDIFLPSNKGILLSNDYRDFDSRSRIIGKIINELVKLRELPTLVEEMYPVRESFLNMPLFEIDRVAVPYFGVRSFGVHLNGYVVGQKTTEMWIAKRAKDRTICPNMLDNLVAGGLPINLGIIDNLVKESDEEASIPKELVKKAIPVGAISYIMEIQSGLKLDTIFCFDLELPNNFTPKNKDGEVAKFFRHSLNKVAKIVESSFEFKFNCNLVIIDFLIRKGLILPDHPDYLDLIKGLHR